MKWLGWFSFTDLVRKYIVVEPKQFSLSLALSLRLLKHVYIYYHQSLIFPHFFSLFLLCSYTRLDDNEDVDRVSSLKTTHIHKCLIAFSFFFLTRRTNEWANPLLIRRSSEYIWARQVACVCRLSSIQFCRFLSFFLLFVVCFIVQSRQYIIRT
jgi:hypothetical protein